MRGDSKSLRTIRLRLFEKPVYYRRYTSDLAVLKQVFIDNQFGSPNLPSNPASIVDVGANCGYSALYFASEYPSAQVIAIEPDAENFEVLQRNCENIAGRIRPIQAALWHEDGTVCAADTGFRGGGKWAIQVQKATDNESSNEVIAISPETLLTMVDKTPLDILKVDIEGAEVALLLRPDTRWLEQIRCLIIELHNDVHIDNICASEALAQALVGKSYSREKFHENEIVNFRESAPLE